jgi:hypothetical protein
MAIVGRLSWDGESGPQQVPVAARLLIGSGAGCGVVVKDAAPNHCEILRTPDGYVARDLTGQTLLRINGARVDEQVLVDGDRVQVMSGQFSFSLAAADEAAVPDAPAPALPVHVPRRRAPSAAAARSRSRSGGGQKVLLGAGAAGVLILGIWLLLPAAPPPPRVSAQRPAGGERPGTASPAPLSKTEAVEPAPSEAPAAPAAPAEPPPAPEASPREAPRADRDAFRPGSSAPSPAGAAVPAAAFNAEAPPPILRQYDRPDLVDRKAEAAARSSPRFEVRYAGLLVQLHRAFAGGGDYEAAYRSLMEASPEGGPPGADAHLKALAASLKSAVYCTQCKAGRLSCPDCEGKGKTDQNCAVCEGKGRVRPPGAVGKAVVSVKCRNCEGQKVFKGVVCSTCSRTGSIACPSCKGSPWRASACYAAGCKEGRTPCAGCEGRGWVTVKCPFCTNGRAQAPGAVNGANVTMKCRNCEVDGQQGNGTLRHECRSCGKTGRVTCEDCGGVFSGKRGPGFRQVPITDVFRAEGCAVASVASGPLPCSKCVGLGVRIRPASDPSKVLD